MSKSLSERLRAELAAVSSPSMGGDNLAVTLASYFEPHVESEELDDTDTWKQEAVDQTNEVLDAIHLHYADALDAKDALLREAREDVGLLIKQLTKIQENAQRSGGLVYHPKSPMAEQIDKISALLLKLTDTQK